MNAKSIELSVPFLNTCFTPLFEYVSVTRLKKLLEGHLTGTQSYRV